MDERPIPAGISDQPPESDPATRAFTELRGELALLRRAIEHLAAEKTDIDIPDYSSTLGEVAKRLISMERKPAMQMTPEDMAARIDVAAAQARREDQATLAEAKRNHGEAIRDLRASIGTASTINEHNRRLWRWSSGSFFAGCLIWAALPGFFARIAPTDWHWPERIAARTVREPTLWEAGTRIMRADRPAAWQSIADAAELRRDNREAINACEQRAAKAKQPVQCTIRVRASAR